MDTAEFVARGRDACAEFGKGQLDDGKWERFAALLTYVPQGDGTARAGRRGAQGLGGARRRGRRTPPALPLGAAQGGPRRGPPARRGRAGRALADHHGEAVRHRPRVGRGPQQRGAPDLRRVADLPDRPLPRQGGGAEHPRVPLRQRPLRADLEPQLHPARADRRTRDARPRGPYVVLRVHRRLPRHGGHPPDAGARVHGDGAADLAAAGTDQRREAQGVPLDEADRAARRRPRPVRRLPRQGGGRGVLRHRDLHRPADRDRQLALGRRPVLPAHRQEARRGRPGHLDRVQGAAALDVPRRGRTPACRVPTT